jgi:hypothetical protein
MTEAELEQVQAPAAPAPAPANQQLGTTGVIMMAILAGVVAWLLSSFIKL